MVHAYKQGKLKSASPEVKEVASGVNDGQSREFASSVMAKVSKKRARGKR